jgi:antibiotic biosynthesis monooxygenase (ABM) superfamily enzyme
MIIRSAVLEGVVEEAARTAFDRRMSTDVLAAIRRYPGIRGVHLRRPVETEPGAPPVYLIFDLRFDSLEAMHAALASPVRQEVRELIKEAMSGFTGRVYHLVLEEDELR